MSHSDTLATRSHNWPRHVDHIPAASENPNQRAAPPNRKLKQPNPSWTKALALHSHQDQDTYRPPCRPVHQNVCCAYSTMARQQTMPPDPTKAIKTQQEQP